MMNPNWDRWIFASVADYFQTQANSFPIKMYATGDDRDTNLVEDFIEFRMDGPIAQQTGPTEWLLDVHFDVLLQTIKSDTDVYKYRRQIGFIQSIFKNDFQILRIGPDMMGVDDGGLEGCLQAKEGFRAAMVTTELGQILSDLRIMQATVEAHYGGFFYN